jgi:hypothetical protein
MLDVEGHPVSCIRHLAATATDAGHYQACTLGGFLADFGELSRAALGMTG